jgi:hypothetical protein
VLALPFDEIVRVELRVIVEQIRSLNKSIAESRHSITLFCPEVMHKRKRLWSSGQKEPV